MNFREKRDQCLKKEREFGVGVRLRQLKKWIEESAGHENIGGELALLLEDGESLSKRGAGRELLMMMLLPFERRKLRLMAGRIHFKFRILLKGV